jgi:DNA-nicking Smr family endonuclease
MSTDTDPTWRRATIDVKPLAKRRTVPNQLSAEELARKPIKPKPAFVIKANLRARTQGAFDAKIDLHGLTESAAHQTLLAFIDRAVLQGQRHVLVITGKGGKTAAGLAGALRTNVPRWLDAAPQGRHVADITTAPQQQGGDGAYIIRLKKQR